jgi:hypothetical protein
MWIRRPRRRLRLRALLCAAPLVHLCGCGTLISPNRHGQARGGQMDPAVVVMDGVLLLLFIVPGLVAFVIDFHTGAIYLPKGRNAFAVPADAVPQVLPIDAETARRWLAGEVSLFSDAATLAASVSRG